MEPIKFRDAAEADLDKIVEIYNSTVASRMSTADTEPVSVESRKKWFDEHNHFRPLWIAEDSDNNVVGWVSFQSFYGRPAYNATVEISIYIDANHRGKGIGKKMLEYSIAAAPTIQIKTLVGFIFAHNDPSLKLFKSFGFEEWGNLPDIAVLDGKERGLKILGKRVG
ncbi:phosphinothricin acetyltransferase [Mucilaginibacter gossypiicola]|uniref:Phosphinothricin acetyltransferase n=1 Tax=Mucilaginibacter gossypiicola TaxID=551995 RepID=A0A1H8EZH4_9SPHI|nr:GNAT family N-acetyltransferase [Mucilaginibacter gossypiicola]SEN24902.1 phosphinothricin acetyltransferase [Mucilaginibacter gossypiicola]